jgi:cytochrome c biogenesis protein CcmG/thiol:disulfide interchange protein DsbE
MTALPQSEPPRRLGPSLAVLVPLALFLLVAGLFFARLDSGKDSSLLPSVLIGHPAPQTPLPPVAGLVRDGQPVPGLAPADFTGQVTVLNVWASWCVPCHDEAPLLMRLAQDKRIRVVSINQKDDADNARRFLGRYGNPYAAVGADRNGRASIEWGVYGVPENFIVGRDGKIAFKLVGPLTSDNLDSVFRPEIEKAIAANKTAAK